MYIYYIPDHVHMSYSHSTIKIPTYMAQHIIPYPKSSTCACSCACTCKASFFSALNAFRRSSAVYHLQSMHEVFQRVLRLCTLFSAYTRVVQDLEWFLNVLQAGLTASFLEMGGFRLCASNMFSNSSSNIDYGHKSSIWRLDCRQLSAVIIFEATASVHATPISQGWSGWLLIWQSAHCYLNVYSAASTQT